MEGKWIVVCLTFPGVFTPNREKNNSTKNYLNELVRLLGFLTAWMRGYLQEHKWPPNSCIITKSYHTMDGDLMEPEL